MDTMAAIAEAAIADMPPAGRFTTADAELIRSQRDALLSVSDRLVADFYDTVFAHPPTAGVFRDGERAARESTLAQWWQRTVIGPLDQDYFAWMALVGLVHVVRRVSNPMMLAMADFTVTFVAEHAAAAGIDSSIAESLGHAFRRLAATVGAIIVGASEHAVSSALYEVVGMPEALLERLRDAEVNEALDTARIQTGHR